mgnify:CR=1 FL=1
MREGGPRPGLASGAGSKALLRCAVGGTFVVAAASKLLHLPAPAFRETLAWSLAGGRIGPAVLVYVAEGLAGLGLLLGVCRALSAGLLAVLVLGGAVGGMLTASGTSRPCGCFGSVALDQRLPFPQTLRSALALLVLLYLLLLECKGRLGASSPGPN